jgi:hypothetical protein
MPRPPPLPRVEEDKNRDQAPSGVRPEKVDPEVVAVIRAKAARAREPEAEPAVISTTDELIQEPSLLEVFAEELRIKYRLPEDDPTFALISLFSEVERRELKRQQAFEHFANGMLAEAKQVLESANELSTTIGTTFQRLDGLDIGISEVQECVQRFEESCDNIANETKPRLIAMAELQSKLESAVFVGLEKNFWSRLINRLIFALALLAGFLIGGAVMLLTRH